MDHTDAGTTYQKVQWLNGGVNGRVGIAKTISVMPGDEVTASAYVKYMNLGTTSNPNVILTSLANLFGVSSSPTGEQLKLYNGLNSYAATIPAGDHTGDDESAPKAFITILFFDKDYNFVDAAWDQVSTTGAQTSPTVKGPHDFVTITKKAPAAGYAYVFYSNEHPTFVDVYFDDATVSFTPSAIVQMNDYYPFGLTFNSYLRENSVPNMYQYNGKEKQDELDLGWLDYGARMYSPQIGRWTSLDPLSENYLSTSSYSYALNNPSSLIDIEGAVVGDPKYSGTGNVVIIIADGATDIWDASSLDATNWDYGIFQNLDEAQNWLSGTYGKDGIKISNLVIRGHGGGDDDLPNAIFKALNGRAKNLTIYTNGSLTSLKGVKRQVRVGEHINTKKNQWQPWRSTSSAGHTKMTSAPGLGGAGGFVFFPNFRG